MFTIAKSNKQCTILDKHTVYYHYISITTNRSKDIFRDNTKIKLNHNRPHLLHFLFLKIRFIISLDLTIISTDMSAASHLLSVIYNDTRGSFLSVI